MSSSRSIGLDLATIVTHALGRDWVTPLSDIIAGYIVDPFPWIMFELTTSTDVVTVKCPSELLGTALWLQPTRVSIHLDLTDADCKQHFYYPDTVVQLYFQSNTHPTIRLPYHHILPIDPQQPRQLQLPQQSLRFAADGNHAILKYHHTATGEVKFDSLDLTLIPLSHPPFIHPLTSPRSVG